MISEVVFLFSQTLSWHFNGLPGAGDAAATNKPAPAVLQDRRGEKMSGGEENVATTPAD